MAINGTININLSFLDSSSGDSGNVEKKLSLASSDVVSSGKVAIVSGTIGTSNLTIECQPTSYRDSSGDLVSFGTIRKVALYSSRSARLIDGQTEYPAYGTRIVESDGDVVVSRYVSSGGFGVGPKLEIDPGYSSGSANYTVLIYGE